MWIWRCIYGNHRAATRTFTTPSNCLERSEQLPRTLRAIAKNAQSNCQEHSFIICYLTFRSQAAQVVVAKVLAALWQLMMHQRGQNLLQLQEETFSWDVVVGKHVEGQR